VTDPLDRRPAVALATCSELPDLDPDDRLLLAPLAETGIDATAVVWDDPAVDWAAFDLVVVRNTWDYPLRRDQFVAWARSVPALANPAEVIAWNTDKRYLRDLATAGVPVVPTTWVPPDEAWSPPVDGEWVVKPAVSIGSRDTGRYLLPAQRDLAAAHVARLQAAGRLAMAQPYVPSVDSYGETALIYLGGAYSHAIRKGPMLSGPDPQVRGADGGDVLYVEEHITPRTPTDAERAVADATLRALPFDASGLLYARVDLLDTPDGPIVIEVELTEPSLFVGTAAGAPERFAAAVARHLAARPGAVDSRTGARG
jgi:glutathione synthase/RimK-type ligase-like ATP-grasp enzyme